MCGPTTSPPPLFSPSLKLFEQIQNQIKQPPTPLQPAPPMNGRGTASSWRTTTARSRSSSPCRSWRRPPPTSPTSSTPSPRYGCVLMYLYIYFIYLLELGELVMFVLLFHLLVGWLVGVWIIDGLITPHYQESMLIF